MTNAGMTDSWFHTWPERTYERLEGSTPSESPQHRAPVPLSCLLSHMSLAYSPITKGLHVLKTESVDAKSEEVCAIDEIDSSLNVRESTEKDGIDEKGHGLVLQSCLGQREDNLTNPWTSKIGYVTSDSDERSFPDITDADTENVKSPFESHKFHSDQNAGCAAKGEIVIATESSSFSSIVSSLSDAYTSNLGDATSEKLSVSEVDDDKSQNSIDCSEQSKFFTSHSPKVPKKKGISGFFSKNVFAWKGTNASQSSSNSEPGASGTWKFLGKAFNLTTEVPLTSHSSESSLRGSSLSINEGGNTQRYGSVVASSSALILNDRPTSLPAKSEDERDKHHQEYLDIVEAAKRKDIKDSKLKKKSLQQQLKTEEQLANAVRIWNSEILQRWDEMRNQKRTKQLWWLGLPPCVRGKVWQLAIGNELNITHQLYNICATRAEERLKQSPKYDDVELENSTDKESSMELIQLDIARTFPQLCIFQKGGPYYEILHSLLGAYVCYRPDVGYVQGMSFIAAVLILNLDAPEAFVCFSNLLNRPCLHSFFTLSQPMMQAYYDTYNELLKENHPKLEDHFRRAGLSPDLYILDWVYTLFVKAMNLDVACRVWDVFLRDGEEFIFRTALGILHLYKEQLLQLDFVHGAQFLTRLPENLSADLLFQSIEAIKMTAGKQKFSQVLSANIARCTSR